MISFGVIGSSIKGGNVDLLSALTVPENERPEILRKVKDACGFAELTAVFTCNRVEFYFIADGSEPVTVRRNRLLDFFLRGHSKLSFEPSDIYCHTAFRALKHLYRVAASLDSMMVGEAQILGQVKKAVADCREMDCSGPQLDEIFTEAFRVAKKIRRETPLGENSVSMVSLVVDEVFAHVADRAHSTVALIGVGPMSVKLGEHLKSRRDIELLVVNRSLDKAEDLANKIGARAMELDRFVEAPPAVDVVFSSTSASEPIIGPAVVDLLRSCRKEATPLLLIDLAIPHDIDPAVAECDGVIYRDIPFFQHVADRNRRERFKAVDQAERIVDAEIGRAHRQNAERQFKPVFASSLNEAMAYAHAGLERLFSAKLGHLDECDRSQLTYFVEKLVRYTNHLPVSALAEQADTSQGSCAMIAGYGCVQTRVEGGAPEHDPVAHKCAQSERGTCVMDGKHAFMIK